MLRGAAQWRLIALPPRASNMMRQGKRRSAAASLIALLGSVSTLRAQA